MVAACSGKGGGSDASARATSAGPGAPASTAPAAPSGIASGPSGTSDSPACAAYFRALECLGGKMPGAAGESMRANATRMREVLARPGTDAARACTGALPELDPFMRQYGCAPGGAASAVPMPSASADDSIVIGPDGVSVPSAPLRGDPKDCAVVHACCDAAMKSGLDELGLACALAQAAHAGECGAVARDVRALFTELRRAPPPGCK